MRTGCGSALHSKGRRVLYPLDTLPPDTLPLPDTLPPDILSPGYTTPRRDLTSGIPTPLSRDLVPGIPYPPEKTWDQWPGRNLGPEIPYLPPWTDRRLWKQNFPLRSVINSWLCGLLKTCIVPNRVFQTVSLTLTISNIVVVYIDCLKQFWNTRIFSLKVSQIDLVTQLKQ